MSTPSVIPPLPGTFDANLWRQRLAGLTDPDYSADDNPAAQEYKVRAVELVLCLCELFGDSLDRMTLWDRIGSALGASCAKCDDGDIDRFVSAALEHVKADAGASSRNDRLAKQLPAMCAKGLSWRQGFVRYVASHSFSVLAHGRLAWEKVKEGRKA